ncbi:MAG: PPC domain-containing protein, partial [Chthoniobacteraceae bacterium]
NPRTFVAGDRPEFTRTKAHDKPEAAVEMPMGSVFNGNATAAASDYFRVSAKKGERVLIECAAREIDSRMSPVLAVLDASGREIGSARKGGLLDFTAPSDGQFLVTLHDLTFAGGPDYFYRLTISKGPYVDFIFPPAGVPGSKTTFTLYGRGLPGGKPANLRGGDKKPLEKLEVEIALPAANDATRKQFMRPVSAVDDGIFYSLKSAEGASNPVFIGFSSVPLTREIEPNNKAGQAQKIPVPCEVAGQFFPAADVDCYAFDAKKGDAYWLEVFSHRTGRTTSPFLLVQREGTDIKEVYASDADPGGKRFPTLSNDPAFRFEAKEDGTYRVFVRDLFGETRSNPASTYRLAIRKETPDFRLVAIVEPPPPAGKKDERSAAPRGLLLRAGETVAVKVLAIRRDGFTGPIELSATELPDGVKCVPTKIGEGKTDGILLLTAGEKPAKSCAAIRIIGKAKAGGTELQREATGGTVVWSVTDYNIDAVPSRLTADFCIAVNGAEAAPIRIEPAEDKVWQAQPGTKLEIPLRITRSGEFKDALKLKAAGVAGIEALKEIDVDAKATTATATLDLKALKLPGGESTIFFSAATKGKYGKKDVTTTVHSAPIRISIQ